MAQAIRKRRAPIEREDGFVIKVFSNGFVVHVPRFGIEGVIRLRDLLLSSEGNSRKEPESRFASEEWRLDVNIDNDDDDGKGGGGGRWLRVELFQKVIVKIWDELEEGTGKRRVRMGLVI